MIIRTMTDLRRELARLLNFSDRDQHDSHTAKALGQLCRNVWHGAIGDKLRPGDDWGRYITERGVKAEIADIKACLAKKTVKAAG